MVIVVLGVIAAVAIPRFFDSREEAAEATFGQVRGSFATGVSLVRAKSAILKQGDTFPDVLVAGNCVDVQPVSGFPSVDQSPGTCSAVGARGDAAGDAEAGLGALLLAWIGIPAAHAIPPPPGPGPGLTLPELLTSLDISDWTWTTSGSTGTLTSPHGLSFSYNHDTGTIN